MDKGKTEMVKNKRLLTALIVIVALTVPRFVFIQVREEEAVYFDENNMPDGPGDMKDWFPMQVLVCPECTKALEERFAKKDFDNPTQFQLYYFPQHSRSIIRRCPLHPDITAHFPGEFDWDYDPSDGGNPGEMAIPRNLLDVYPRQVRLQADRIFTIVICPQCLKELSEKIASVESSEGRSNTLEEMQRKMERLEPIGELQARLFYPSVLVKDYYCGFHPDRKMSATVKIPVHPQVRNNLPEDTRYITRKYLSADSQFIDMTIVTSGKDKRSIHRPERCLTAQGYFIDDRRPITIKIPGSKIEKINVMKLRMIRTRTDPDTEELKTDKLIVFYWYASVERLTESNTRRLLHTAWDRMILGKNYHWSYVLLHSPVAGDQPDDEERTVKGLYTFMQQFFPKVER
jgi:EpsI family protein